MAETAGEISKFNSYFEWNVTDFFSRPEKSDESCTSPGFLVAHDAWAISLYPDGNNCPEWISLYLKRLTTNENMFANFTLAIKRSDGSQYAKRTEHLFSEEENDWGWVLFVQKSEILSAKSLMAPGNVVTISCTICSEPFAVEATWDTSKLDHLSSGGPSTRPKILWESLSCNLKDLFLNRTHSDLVIKVRDEEFPVHKMILSARSTVFAAMFEHKTVENLNGIVEISDANPVVFRDLLLFIYSGELRTLSLENVHELYALSDKYNLKDLKEECRSFIECPLSVNTVCNVSVFAEKCNSRSKCENFCIVL